MMVDLEPEQARYLSILAASDMRSDEERGLSVMLPAHRAAWEALQEACQWDRDV